MEHQEAVNLIMKGFDSISINQVWADIGCGEGVFTKALASLLSEGSMIYAIDKNQNSLQAIPEVFENVKILKVLQDWRKT